MISVQTMDGDLIKVINTKQNLTFGFHRLFGLISEDKANKRVEVRKRQGFEFTNHEWLFNFSLIVDGDRFNLKALNDCQVKKVKENNFKLITPHGEFQLLANTTGLINDGLITEVDNHSWMNRWTEFILLGIFLIIPILYYLRPSPVEEIEQKKKVIEAVSVKVVQPANAVNINTANKDLKIKPMTQTQKSKRSVRRNLGFLGLVGSKDLTKAVGGVPQKLKKASAGAGKGGDAGSGGEVLTGLGKGLKKTTVGNTGVAGLGGIGTKGAGGGAGGYGNTMVASGEGVGISAISVASNDMLLDGGLSRYAINATIAKYLSQVRRCYENQLNKQPGLEGLVTVGFQINGNGMLNYSRVKSTTLKSAVVEKCITTKMMTWQFPKPKGGVNVNINYPFMLRPVGT